MSSTIQRSFAGGELAPALLARADLARYAIGLRTCRNMVVMRAGGATKRPGTAFILAVGTSTASSLTIPGTLSVAAGSSAGITASLLNGIGQPIPGYTVTWQTDDPTIATVTSTGPLSATVAGIAGGTVHIRGHVAALGLVSNDCVVTVTDEWIIHAFDTPGLDHLDVTAGSGPAETLIVAGGGSAGSVDGTGAVAGGGGAGGVIQESAHALTPQNYAVVVGGGVNAPDADASIGIPVVPGNNGGDSSFDGQLAKGGGGGGAGTSPTGGDRDGLDGGSGGGGGTGTGPGGGGLGTAGQGSNGGAGSATLTNGGGGGGAGGVGAPGASGTGGAGVSSSIDGTPTTYGPGGNSIINTTGSAATAIGGGGNGGGNVRTAINGASMRGRVVIRYKQSTGIVATGGVITTIPI